MIFNMCTPTPTPTCSICFIDSDFCGDCILKASATDHDNGDTREDANTSLDLNDIFLNEPRYSPS
jgi:hypothetical protein